VRTIKLITKYKKSVLLALFSVFFAGLASAQITVDKTFGCVPLTVNFTAPAGSINSLWTFELNSTTNVQNPPHIFTKAGVYNVTYVGSAGSFNKTITVFAKPVAQFSATPLSGCVPFAVKFKDESVGGGNTAITAWQWTAGDGGTIPSVQNPNYTFSLIGSFNNNALTVTDANGCKDDTTWTTPIVVSNTPPVAAFTPSVSQSCTAPLTVNFQNNSTAGKGGLLTYAWDFGNGSNSILTTPNAVTYNAIGVYTVKLTVSEANGCVATTTSLIVVNKPTASFSLANDSACPNSNVFFNNSSIGANSYSWNFGDNSPVVNTTSPTHVFAAPGTYNVKLTSSANGCDDDTTFAFVVENVVANFTRTPTYNCDFPLKNSFTNTSVPKGVSWSWAFPQNKSSVQQNPSNTITKPDDSEYTVYDPLFFPTTLQVTTALGCKAIVTKTDTIIPIIARFQPDKKEGCAPLTVTFSDSSRSKEAINLWHWDFGDNQTANIKNPAPHTYNTPGEYKVVLNVSNVKGCTDTSYVIVIKVGDVTATNFSVSSASVCPNEAVTFTDLTPGNKVTAWHYSADGGNVSACASDSTWTTSFNGVAGPQDVTLTTVYNGCSSSKTITNAVTLKGPIARLTYSAQCDKPLDYTFKGKISGADSWTWNFGDATIVPGSTDSTVTHTYAASGNYQVILKGTNGTSGCADYADTVDVVVRQVKAVITTAAVICKQVEHTFSAASSVDVFSACQNGYRWDWGDGSVPSLTGITTANHTYANFGKDAVRLIVSAQNGCKDTAFFNLKVYHIVAGYTMDNTSRCLPFPVIFNDTTHSDTAVVAWKWNFGDATSLSNTANIKSPTHNYSSKVGNPFSVKMIVTDKLGCQDSIVKVVTPWLPVTEFSASDQTLCTNVATTFTAAGNQNTQFTWDFGDGSPLTTVNNNPVVAHAFKNAPGPYDVKLVVKDVHGCKDSLIKSAFIDVQSYPVASCTSNADSTANLCYPFVAAFYDHSTANSPVNIVSWNVGTGDPVLPQSPVKFTYGQPGTYNAKLVVQTSFGCQDDTIRAITIVGPVADFTLDKNLICIGDSVKFTMVNPKDVATWEWDFSGRIVQGQNPVYNKFDFYPPGGINTVSLTVYSAGKACSNSPKHTVQLHNAYARFGISDSALCLGDKLTVTDSSGGADSWEWVLSPTQQKFNGQVVAPITIASVGNYTMSLRIADNASGCKDTTEKKVVMSAQPSFNTSDVAMCFGDSKMLSATPKLGYQYVWSPTDSLSTPNQASTLAHPSKSTAYTVTVSDTKSCVLAKTVNATVYNQIPFILTDTCVIIGQSTILGTDQGDGYTYDWTSGETKNLSCTDCPMPSLVVLQDGTYKLVMRDTMNCFESTKIYKICVRKIFTMDVPTAFTPDADGINDLVFVKGWGIEKLLTFRIFNRWGEIVFESNDINQGWDGIYKGQPQNMESYVYYAEVQYFGGAKDSKTGSLTIIR